MATKRPTLPPAWYQTLAETAAEFRTHPDRILYYADAGLILPAALIPKALLSAPDSGPSPNLVVRLDAYRQMPWTPDGIDMIAPLVGVHRAYQVDGLGFSNLELDAPGLFIRRSQLVLTIDQIDALQDACGAAKPPHPTKLRTLQRLLGYLVKERWGDAGPYTIGEALARSFQLQGLTISKESVATHVKEARSEFAFAIRRATTTANEAELRRVA